MPQCTCCTHPEREAIDLDLVAGVSLRHVAARYGLTLASVGRHRRKHVAADLEAAGIARVEDLAADVRMLWDRCIALLDAAEADDDRRSALAAIREARSCVETIAKLAVADDLEKRLTAVEERMTAGGEPWN